MAVSVSAWWWHARLLMEPRLLVADEPVSMVDASLRATILESINELNRDLGITILYITHDLTTAYHVSDYIIVLYRGSVMEAGNVDTIILDPKHPYTQLLIDSIPWPDLTRHGASRKSSHSMMIRQRYRGRAANSPAAARMLWTSASRVRRPSIWWTMIGGIMFSVRKQRCSAR